MALVASDSLRGFGIIECAYIMLFSRTLSWFLSLYRWDCDDLSLILCKERVMKDNHIPEKICSKAISALLNVSHVCAYTHCAIGFGHVLLKYLLPNSLLMNIT